MIAQTGRWARFWIGLLLALGAGRLSHAAEEIVEFGSFGQVTLYHQVSKPSHVVLFFSGDGGWNQGVVDMARSLSTMDALVAGIDVVHYLGRLSAAGDACSYPAGDLENLSKFLQKKFEFPVYVKPVLVGYSSGATLVYAALAQAPTNTFQGAISLGFCPDLTLSKPLCKGDGLVGVKGNKPQLYRFSPSPRLNAHWIAFHGSVDQVCDATTVSEYVKQVGNAELVLLPKVGHGFSVQKNWLPQFRDAFSRLTSTRDDPPRPSADSGLVDLPLIELPVAGTDTLAVIVSGDGGWAGLDRQVAQELVRNGIAVVGLNSLQYFWNPRTPDEGGRDLERLLRHYLPAWKQNDAILIGYSLGADVLPFLISRQPNDLLSRIRLVVLLGPSRTANFEFHFTDWLGVAPANPLPVLPEIKKLAQLKILCIVGETETDSLCSDLPHSLAQVVRVPGGHHFGGDFQSLARTIMEAAQTKSP